MKVAMRDAYSRYSSGSSMAGAAAWIEQGELWRTLVCTRALAMASVLSLPRLPVASPTTASSRFSTSPSGFCNSRQFVWCAAAAEEPDRASLSCAVVDGAASGIAVGCNVGLETQVSASRSSVRCCSGDEQGACTPSGSSGDGIGDEAMPGRREVFGVALAAGLLGVFGGGGEAMARDRRNKKEIAAADYLTSGTGLKYFDIEEGRGAVAEKGETVMVHFDCVYRSITAVSSRESKILAGNRTIAEPYELTVGAEPGRERKRDFVDNANGLFSAQAAPKPPPALYSITEGMRVGGKRTVIVPPEFGYGQKGLNEIPPGATFDLNIELLEVKRPQN